MEGTLGAPVSISTLFVLLALKAVLPAMILDLVERSSDSV